MMEYNEYKNLYNRLNTIGDINKMIQKGYDEELLTTLLSQKVNRETKKRFHVVKQNSERLLRDWKRGKSLMQISEDWRFPPILTAMLIFLEDGASRKEFWSYIRDPESIGDDVIAEEIREIVRSDLVYSPDANERHRKRGIWGETLLQDWLDSQNITYRTECDLRGTHTKTPDCLLDAPLIYDGKEIRWIESKATFGDNIEFRFNARKQLMPYTHLFGPGLVIYWLGRLDDLEMPDGIYVADISVLDSKLRPANGSGASE
jgi:hypothetical protein